jgi:Pre ATP-grasp domain
MPAAHGTHDPASKGGFGSCVTVVRRRFPAVPEAELAAIAELAADIRSADPGIGRTDHFGPLVHQGCSRSKTVLFGGSGEIPLLADMGINRLDYRIGFLAREGDMVVIGGPASPAFEAYQKKVLGLAELQYLAIDPPAGQMARATPVACLREETPYGVLRRFTETNGGATLMAYLTTGTIWALAARLSRDTGQPIHVAGPSPLLSRRANNKLWFGEIVTRLLGSGSAPPRRTAHNAAAVTRHVGELMRKWDRLVLKVPDSAGSAGNVVVISEDVRSMGAKALDRHLRTLLTFPAGTNIYPLAVEVWDANVLTSPSVQIWIPRPDEGAPVIEGVFEQMLAGDEAAFTGAVAADFPERLDRALCEQAMRLSLLLQHLGYFGRCSFDAVAAGRRLEDADVHWIECNARWGGVSIPMSFVNRMGDAPAYAIVQDSSLALNPRPFGEIAAATSDLRPAPNLGRGIVFLSPYGIEAGTGCHFLCFGENGGEALRQSRAILERL